jgi:hypothetical protein
MPMKANSEQVQQVKTVTFGSHGGSVFGDSDHVASTHTRQTNLCTPPHRPLNKMSVVLSPNRNLGFRREFPLLFICLFLTFATGPLTQVVKRSLTITNQNSQPVAFKVKTTAPKVSCGLRNATHMHFDDMTCSCTVCGQTQGVSSQTRASMSLVGKLRLRKPVREYSCTFVKLCCSPSRRSLR